VIISLKDTIPLFFGTFLGIVSFREIITNYYSSILFLFISGFIFSSAISKWKIDEKMVFSLMKMSGRNSRLVILVTIISTSILSTLMTNTTTTALMLPIGVGILEAIKNEDEEYRVSLLLSIAYAASIGGTAILIGTTTNLIGAEYMMREGMEIGFLGWAKILMPFTLILLLILWIYMSWRAPTTKKIRVKTKRIRLEPAAKLTILILLITVFFWLFRPYLSQKFSIEISDVTIGLLGASLLFLVRTKKEPILKIKDVKIPWDIILMLGGALALGNILLSVGISDLFIQFMSFIPKNEISYLLITAIIANFSTELISNTALSATLIPIIIEFYKSAGFSPLLGIFTVAVCSDMAFMLPIATPPNAIISKNKHVTFKKMFSYGMWLNLIVIILWVLYAWLILQF
jgi:sodium-dependent dicarboxylate transporter 2/3/5